MIKHKTHTFLKYSFGVQTEPEHVLPLVTYTKNITNICAHMWTHIWAHLLPSSGSACVLVSSVSI